MDMEEAGARASAEEGERFPKGCEKMLTTGSRQATHSSPEYGKL